MNDLVTSGVRPYGVSLLVAGFDANRGATLYQVDPSGSFWAWKASAIGKNMTNAKTFLEKRCVMEKCYFWLTHPHPLHFRLKVQ
jgi:20S proteasome alpha/beta subunit